MSTKFYDLQNQRIHLGFRMERKNKEERNDGENTEKKNSNFLRNHTIQPLAS